MDEKVRKNTRYGISREEFIMAWEFSGSGKEAYEKLKDRNEKLGLPVMPKSHVFSFAADLRREGVQLKKFRAGRRVKQADELNKLVSKIRREKAASEPEPPPGPDFEELVKVLKQAFVEALVELQTRGTSPPPPPLTTEDIERAKEVMRRLGLLKD